jgi:hypothetical protein
MFKTDKFTKIFNYSLIIFLSLAVGMMLTSFLVRVVFNPPVDAKVKESDKITMQEVIQVNVLNACGTSGLASKAKEFLRARGFDVVEIGNSEKRYEKTVIVDRLGDSVSVKKVARAFGVSDSLIIRQIDSSMFLRATILIGKDFSTLKPFN